MVPIPSPTQLVRNSNPSEEPLYIISKIRYSPCLYLLQTILDKPPLTNNLHTTNHAKTSPWFLHPPHTEDIGRMSPTPAL